MEAGPQGSVIKGTVSRDFLLPVFFTNHLPEALENNIRVISNFSQILAEIFDSPGAPSELTTPAANLATGTAGVVDTGGK